jgi:dihydroorotate dehydrogenase (fumarate)
MRPVHGTPRGRLAESGARPRRGLRPAPGGLSPLTPGGAVPVHHSWVLESDGTHRGGGPVSDITDEVRAIVDEVDPDLTTSYLGLRLRSPLVASAGPATADLASLRALAGAGIAAVVLPSLFEEQIVSESVAVHDALDRGAGADTESAEGYRPAPVQYPDQYAEYNAGPTRYLRLIADAKRTLDVPVIASLNGDTPGGWTTYARMIADAGADALELNIYRIAADARTSGRMIEDEAVQLVSSVRDVTEIPLAVKLGPAYSALPHLARRLVTAGADGLVLFNRLYQPDIDLETLDVTPAMTLSTSEELRLPLRWIAVLHGHIDASLAATTGVHTWQDVAKVLLAGADVTMMTSALLRHGPDHIQDVEWGLRSWMVERGYTSVAQLRGSLSHAAVADPSPFERAYYLRTLTAYSRTFRP